MLTQHCGSIEQNGGRCAQMQKCSSVGKNTSKKMQKVKNIYRLLRGGTPSHASRVPDSYFKRLTFWNRDLEVGTVKWGPGTVR